MQITKYQSEKLTRYMHNAHPFLWGVLGTPNKENTIQEIKGLIADKTSLFSVSNPTYDKMLDDLIFNIRVEGIIERIIDKKLHQRITDDALSELKGYWDHGRMPDLDYLKRKNLFKNEDKRGSLVVQGSSYQLRNQPADIFFNLQHNYRGDKHYIFITEWTVFAGLYFEEILPYLNID